MRNEPLPRAWWLAVLATTVLGAFLRYRDLSQQIVLDDEWHSLAYSATHDAWSLATTYYPNATSIPVNVYHRLLLVTWGWSEVSIRSLSMLSTLATLPLLPWSVARAFRSPQMGLAAGVLFACSPFWIFYGASARPYSTFFTLLWLAYYFLERALAHAEAEASSAPSYSWLLFGVSGALAVWFHLYALPAIAALVLLPAVRLVRQLRAGGFKAQPWRKLLRVCLLSFGVWTLLVLLLYAGPALRGMADKLPIPPAPHGYDLPFLREAVELVSGARYGFLAWLSCAAALAGLPLAAKKNLGFVLLLGLGLAGSLLFTVLLKPEQYYVAIVTCRYNISLFMLYFVGIAALVERLLTLARGWLATRAPRVAEPVFTSVVMACLAAGTLFATPSLRQLSLVPNNFRLHSAYQERYGAWDPSRGYESSFVGSSALSLDRMPRFYAELRDKGAPCRIVEYPLMKRDQENPFYFYQLQHRCEVIAGYSRGDATSQRLDADNNRDHLKFSWLLDVEELERLRRAGASLVVVHLDPRAEARGGRPRPSRETQRVQKALARKLGRATYRDRFVSVFSLQPASR